MIEFNDIDFYGHGPMPHHHHEGHCGPQMPPPPPMPPFDPELKRVFDLAAHADRVAHKALDVAGFASLDAASAKKLAEQTLSVLNKVSMVADKANVKSDRALSEIDLLKDDVTTFLNELNETQKGAGLAADGSYVKNESANYINEATSLADADNKLDAKLKTTSDIVDTLNTNVSGLLRDLSSLQNICRNIIESAGFTEDGQLEGFDNSLIRSANSLSEAIERLANKVTEISTQARDAVTMDDLNEVKDQLDSVSDDVQAVDTRVNNVERRVDAIETNKVGSVVLENTGNLQYTLKVDGVNAGTINIPEDQYLNQVTYNPETKQLIFKFINGSIVTVSVSDIVKEYTAGNGIRIEGTNIIADEYVAGAGLGRADGNDPHELEFNIKIESNSLNILHATREDGLGIDVDALRDAIGRQDIDITNIAGKHLTYNSQTNKIDVNVQSLVADSTFVNAVTNIVRNAMLWEDNPDDATAIQPKNGKNVTVSGTISATGAIYSGQD